MNSQRRGVVVVVAVLVVVMVVVMGYLVGKRIVSQKIDLEKEAVTAQEAFTRRPGDTIIKGQTQDAVNYKLFGSFVEELVPEGRYLVGMFVVTGDELERRIPVFVGIADGSVLWGEYEGNLRGNSKWTTVSTAEIAEWLKPGEEVTVELTLSASGGIEAGFLDQLKQEITDGFNGEPVAVPDYLGLATSKIGGLP